MNFLANLVEIQKKHVVDLLVNYGIRRDLDLFPIYFEKARFLRNRSLRRAVSVEKRNLIGCHKSQMGIP